LSELEEWSFGAALRLANLSPSWCPTKSVSLHAAAQQLDTAAATGAPAAEKDIVKKVEFQSCVLGWDHLYSAYMQRLAVGGGRGWPGPGYCFSPLVTVASLPPEPYTDALLPSYTGKAAQKVRMSTNTAMILDECCSLAFDPWNGPPRGFEGPSQGACSKYDFVDVADDEMASGQTTAQFRLASSAVAAVLECRPDPVKPEEYVFMLFPPAQPSTISE
jgi:hypothetical protein